MVIEEQRLSALASLLIKEIKSSSDFFSGVTVIFPDSNVEKWFKSYWLKKETDVLMNLNSKTIRNALFDLYENENGYTLISKELLKYLILKKLTIDEYKNVNLPDKYKKYFYNEENDSFDSVHLYDLSNELATAFLEFEQGNADLVDSWELDFYERLLEEIKKEYGLVTLTNMEGDFKETTGKTYFFGFIDFTPKQKEIIDLFSKKNEVVIYKLKAEFTLSKTKANFILKTAPSKLREVESLHTNICKLIKENGYDFSDFLVVCPNLSEYETIINRVFKQDDIDYPNIPFTINNSEVAETEVTEAIRKLIEINHKGFYTRRDLFELITNSVVMRSRNITDDDIDKWVNSIIDTNVYRQRDNHDDWDYIKKRLLLSKVANINDDNNVISLQNVDYAPYSSIGYDDDLILRLISIIDDLNSWMKTLANLKNFDKTALNLVKAELDKWLSIPNEDGIESNKLYKNIVLLFETWSDLEIINDKVPLLTFFYALLDASQKSRSSGGQILSSGITFVNFKTDYALEASNVFFLGTSSANIPSKTQTSELYVLKDKASDLEHRAFIIQYQNAPDNFVASYVNVDLKTEEEFYPSMFVSEIQNLYGIKPEKVLLDEKRSWEELFTRREFKEKLYFKGLLDKVEVTAKEEDELVEENVLDVITLKDIEKYLIEPLSFQANRLFIDPDEDRNQMSEEYEPFSINKLQEFVIVKTLIDYGLEGNDITNPVFVSKIKEELKLNNTQCGLSETMDDLELMRIAGNAQKTIDLINELQGNPKGIVKLDDLSLDKDEERITIVCSEEVYRSIDGDTRTYVRLRGASSDKTNKKYLYLYAFSLMDVATLEDGVTYKIVLKTTAGSAKFEITKEEAIALLKEIYSRINTIKGTKCIPIEKKGSVNSCYDLYNDIIGDGKEWAYFSHSKAFDDSKLGYDDDNFDYFESDLEFKTLLKFIKPKEEEEENSNG